MINIQETKFLKKALQPSRLKGKTIGFVPTMGALHKGHLALIKRSVAENDICVCSIFVNPIQFNNKEDLKKYPRDLDDDFKKLEAVGCQYVFVPDVKEMYPKSDLTQFDFGHLDKILEGKFRPGHFNGVAIIVKKLLKIVEPSRAYFGEKDFQQLAVINRLVELENLTVEIIPCPIIREVDGLAMSSRNARLSQEERKIAPIIYQNLITIKESFNGKNLDELRKNAIDNLNNQDGMSVEYLEIVDEKTLLSNAKGTPDKHGLIALVATFLGDVRLIDNIKLF